MNKFLITGIPRSGTTALIKTLSKIDDVFMYSGDNNPFFEPFSLGNKTQYLNPYQLIEEAESNCNSKYFGFKCFNELVIDINKLNEHMNYKTFAIIRKDIWKSVFSHHIAKTKWFKENIDIFHSSSTLHAEKTIINNIKDLHPAEARNLKLSYFTRIKECYDFETQWKNIDIIYFEDLIKPNASFDCLNEYFGQTITFNLNYDDSHDVEGYFSNWNLDVLRSLSKDVEATVSIPNDCPSYIKESMYKFIKKD